jgi:PTH1 family peptidyl-tRNA hydrolase
MTGWLGHWLRRRPKNSPDETYKADSWILVPLGNPGEEYALTRHNLGRLLLQRWSSAQGRPKPIHIRAFNSGTFHGLGGSLLALMPGTYMNLSGQVCEEAAAAGIEPSRFILLQDDKDLPLGLGRFRLDGGDGGHNGLRSVFEYLGTQNVARLRLGIGPFTRPLDQFVLGEWTDEEWSRIEAMDAPFERFMEMLAQLKELSHLPGIVNDGKFWGESPVKSGVVS